MNPQQPSLFDYMPPHAAYPYAAGHRRIDTSKEAAAKVDAKPSRRERCYQDIEAALLMRGAKGATTSELVGLLVKYDVSYLQPRTTELYKLGRILYEGQRRDNEKGNSERVWVV